MTFADLSWSPLAGCTYRWMDARVWRYTFINESVTTESRRTMASRLCWKVDGRFRGANLAPTWHLSLRSRVWHAHYAVVSQLLWPAALDQAGYALGLRWMN